MAIRSFLAEVDRYFMGDAPVHHATKKIAKRLDELGIPYVIAGALALVAYGYRRMTEDVDVLLTPEGLRRFKEASLGLGWVERFPGSKGIRDPEHNVKIDVLLAGEYPGDGKPKPIAFPDPAQVVGITEEGVRYIALPRLVELKLASGMTGAGRIKDLGDVQELIKHCHLAEDFAHQLNPYVREKFLELWRDAQNADDEEY